jgi:hypothetical protein
MQINTGIEVTYLVGSVNGRCVATFVREQDREEWLEARSHNGVSYKRFKKVTDIVEEPAEQG